MFDCSIGEQDGGELLLEKVLDGLDVVVGGLLDVLDALRVGDGELRGDLVDGLRLRRRQPALTDLRLGRKGLEPRALDEHPPLDEPELGEDLLQFGALVRITPVDGADRQQRIDVHRRVLYQIWIRTEQTAGLRSL